MKNSNIRTSNIDRLVGLKKIHVDWLMEPDKIVTTSMVPRFLSLFFAYNQVTVKARKWQAKNMHANLSNSLQKLYFS